jgi:hypothetical protein
MVDKKGGAEGRKESKVDKKEGRKERQIIKGRAL